MRHNGRPWIAASTSPRRIHMRETTHSFACHDCGQWEDLRKGDIADRDSKGQIMGGQTVRLIAVHRPDGKRCPGSGQRIVLDMSLATWRQRLKKRGRMRASTIAVSDIDLTIGQQQPSIVCRDCKTWRALEDVLPRTGSDPVWMITPHRNGSGNALCLSSGRHVVLDRDPILWKEALDRQIANQETVDAGSRTRTTVSKRPSPPAPAVLQIAQQRQSQRPAEQARLKLRAHQDLCRSCLAAKYGRGIPCATGTELTATYRTEMTKENQAQPSTKDQAKARAGQWKKVLPAVQLADAQRFPGHLTAQLPEAPMPPRSTLHPEPRH
ncbi:hypothetical protein [Streptomyces sp. NRRL F-2890]|uniref:hypothetical protein n=1 Tax=Streptomyces sp. NRRL F-2890 TaxID=1463845 RepID=UPI0004CC3D7A|nr:hypothetical protein [Streptomyces sp. NRRL F-2890]